MDHVDPDDRDLADQAGEPVPLSPLQALRQRLGLGFGDALSQADIDRLVALHKAQQGRHRAP